MKPLVERFVKEPAGWVCRRCRDATVAATTAADETEDKNARASRQEGRARFFHEGEAGERASELSTRGLARRRTEGGAEIFFCPDCGAEEKIKPPND